MSATPRVVRAHRVSCAGPADVSGLRALLASGALRAQEVIAVLGKTEGNGGRNDFSRGLAMAALEHLFAPRLGVAPEQVQDRVIFSFSGGTEGVVAPHMLVLVREGERDGRRRATKRLAVAIGHTRAFAPEEIGRMAQIEETARVVRDIADQVRVHAPEAWILNFTNPVGIVTRALLDDGHRVLGLCNVASSFTRLFAGLLGVDAASIELDHAGLNHLTWIRSVRVDGAERISELLAAPLRAEIAADIEQPEELLGVLDAIPSYYLKYFYATRSMTARQRENPRVDDVLRIERELLKAG